MLESSSSATKCCNHLQNVGGSPQLILRPKSTPSKLVCVVVLLVEFDSELEFESLFLFFPEIFKLRDLTRRLSCSTTLWLTRLWRLRGTFIGDLRSRAGLAAAMAMVKAKRKIVKKDAATMIAATGVG